jgi:hypothetical protein
MYASDGRPQVSNIIQLNASTTETDIPSSEAANLPAIPRTAGELATIYRKSDRAIQGWVKIVGKAYPWLTASDLKTGRSNQTKYTVLCQVLIQDYRNSGMGADEWITSILAANPSKLPPEPTSPEKTLEGFGLSPERPLEVEVMPDEAIAVGVELHTEHQIYRANPILQVNFESLQIILPGADTRLLEQQTATFQQQTAQAVDALATYVAEDLKAKIATVLAQNTHVAAGVQNAAFIAALKDLGMGKPISAETASPSD